MERLNHRKVAQFLVEGFIGLLFVLGPVYWLDRKGYFVIVDEYVLDVQQNWEMMDWFEGQAHLDVDVLLLGNSIISLGVDAEWLSNATGQTCFILSNPGTDVSTAYWSLQEALKKINPKVVLIETRTMSGEREDTPSDFLRRLIPFQWGKDPSIKRQSLLDLFELDDVLLASSPTLLNHHLIWTNPDSLWERVESPETNGYVLDEFYLGSRITNHVSLQDTTIEHFQAQRGIWDGDQEIKSKDSRTIERIRELSIANNFQLGFLSIPTYDAQISQADKRKHHLAEVISPLDVPWLNLQDSVRFTSCQTCYQNTLSGNLHMRHKGALMMNQSIANWMLDSFNDLHAASPEAQSAWHDYFEVQRGYYAYHHARRKPYAEAGSVGLVWVEEDVQVGSHQLEQLVFSVPETGQKGEVIVTARIPKYWFDGVEPSERKLNAMIQYANQGGAPERGGVLLKWNPNVDDGEHYVFEAKMKPVTIMGVERVRWVLSDLG